PQPWLRQGPRVRAARRDPRSGHVRPNHWLGLHANVRIQRTDMAAGQRTRTSPKELARVAGHAAETMRVLPFLQCWLLLDFKVVAKVQIDHALRITGLSDPAKLA